MADDLCSGKTLGGGTSINGGHYTRGLAAQYDAWLSLLDDDDADSGWDWEGMLGYMKKVCIDIFGSSHILYAIFSPKRSLRRTINRRPKALNRLHRTMERVDPFK